MKPKITALLAALSLSTLPATGLAAGCTRADLAGSWQLYTVFDSVARCTVIMPKTGTDIAINSSCYLPEIVDSVAVAGTITLSANCHVTGNISIGTQQRTIDGYISKKKDTLSGMAWQPGYVYAGDSFSGVKQ